MSGTLLAAPIARAAIREPEASGHNGPTTPRRWLPDPPVLGLMLADTRGEILEANERFLQMLQRTREDLANGGLHLRDLMPPEGDTQGFPWGAEASCETTGCAVWQGNLRRRDGSRVPVVMATAARPESDRHLVFVVDLSERLRAEQDLLEHKGRLERASERAADLIMANEGLSHTAAVLEIERVELARCVEERRQDLVLANGELGRASRLKDEFLANMSHELRTPLNAILGLSESLEEGIYGKLNEKQLRAVHTIIESGRHQLTLVNDVLDISRIEAGRVELDPHSVNVASICRSSAELVKQQAALNQLRFSLRIDPHAETVTADERRLKQILVNLLSNAVKFTPEGGCFGIDVRACPDAGALHFDVWDSGIGIAREDQEHLFKPFVQGDSSLARRYPGSGLGLALVFRLAQLHGGKVTVESARGCGSCFTVSLPWQNTASSTESEAAASSAATPSQNALIVEDSSMTATLLARCLAATGLAARIKATDVDVVEAACEIKPAVILLDIDSPGGTGWDELSRIRTDSRLSEVPVIVLSGVDEQERALSMGAVAHLRKPVIPSNLYEALSAIFADEADTAGGTQPEAERPVAAAAPGALVLLAEDNIPTLETISGYLAAFGYRVLEASDGAQALELARTHRPDLIILDVQMPIVDGLSATQNIRMDPDLARAPVIALTALAMRGDAERCLAAGADRYLAKPVKMSDLVQTIAELLSESRQEITA